MQSECVLFDQIDIFVPNYRPLFPIKYLSNPNHHLAIPEVDPDDIKLVFRQGQVILVHVVINVVLYKLIKHVVHLLMSIAWTIICVLLCCRRAHILWIRLYHFSQ